jgi:hypothetical protein
MTLDQIIAIAGEVSEDDVTVGENLVERYHQYLDGNFGDGLARFITAELAETYDPEASSVEQLNEAARLMKAAHDRRNLARQARAQDENFLRMEFWCYQVEWIGDDSDAPRDAVPASEFVEERLDKEGTTRWEPGDPVVMPDDFAVPEHLQQRTECDCLMVYRDEIHCSASVRHTDVQQETAAGPSDLIEVAAGFRGQVPA